MDDLNRSVVTLLALINPVICSVMLLQRTPGILSTISAWF